MDKRKGFWRKHLWDFVLLFSLLLGTGAFFAVDAIKRRETSSERLYADIYISSSLYRSIDLATASDEKFIVTGEHGNMVIEIKEGAISVKESSCPGKECVNEGWVKEAGHPILCAYNHVLISLRDAKINESVEIG